MKSEKSCPLYVASPEDIDVRCVGEACQLWHLCSGESLSEIADAIDQLVEQIIYLRSG